MAFGILNRRQFNEFVEKRGLYADAGPAGGYMVGSDFLNELLAAEREASVMRQLARVVPPIQGDSIGRPTIESEVDAEWTTELGTIGDNTPSFGKSVLKPTRIAKRIKISRKLLRGSSAGDWVLGMLAAAVTAPQEKAYIQGAAGKDGILSNALVPEVETVGVGALTANDVLEWIYSLPNRMWRQPKILTTVDFIRHVAQIKEVGGGAQAFPELSAGRLCNVPVYYSDGLPAVVSGGSLIGGAYAAIIGDFYTGYWIGDGAETTTVQRLDQLYAETNEVGFQINQESDGAVVAPNAFVKLLIKA